DPAWAKIAAGPTGELYDLVSLSEMVRSLLRGRGVRGRPELSPPDAASREPRGRSSMDRLRAFCRARGIELPYRQTLPQGARAAGLAQALERVAASGHAQVVILISDLEGVLDDAATVRRAVLLLRRRRHHFYVVAPSAPSLADVPRTEAGACVARVLMEEESRRVEHARRELARLGVSVLIAGVDEGADAIVRRLLRARAGVRRAG